MDMGISIIARSAEVGNFTNIGLGARSFQGGLPVFLDAVGLANKEIGTLGVDLLVPFIEALFRDIVLEGQCVAVITRDGFVVLLTIIASLSQGDNVAMAIGDQIFMVVNQFEWLFNSVFGRKGGQVTSCEIGIDRQGQVAMDDGDSASQAKGGCSS